MANLLFKRESYADFVLYESIILEIKSVTSMTDAFIAQKINYLKASGIKLGLVINFEEKSLTHKRVVF